MTQVALVRPASVRSRGVRHTRGPIGQAVLPAWPLLAVLYGLPVFWVVGLTPFFSFGIAMIMLALLIARGGVQLIPGLLPWFGFLLWVVTSGVQLTGVLQGVGFLQRLADLSAVGIFMIYYANARERLTVAEILNGMIAVWFTIVGLGVLAVMFPDFQFTTPVGALLPGSISGNDVVHDLLFPKLAEVQLPWGAAEPFNRPAAPFPYTNSWGMAYVLLLPIAILVMVRAKRWRARIILVASIGLSLIPAVETSNRGMYVGLAIVWTIVVMRLVIRGRWVGAGSLVVIVGSAAAVFAPRVVTMITERQSVSDTTGGRASVYEATWQSVSQSPLLGWATPRGDSTTGIALGTQGYAWTLLYSYGIVGFALFVIFLASVIIRTFRVRGDTALVLNSLVLTCLGTIWYYGLGTTQLTIVGLCAVVLLRSHRNGERL